MILNISEIHKKMIKSFSYFLNIIVLYLLLKQLNVLILMHLEYFIDYLIIIMINL